MMCRQVFTFNLGVFSLSNFLALGLDIHDLAVGVLSLFVLLIVSLLKETMDVREKLAEQNLLFRWGIYYLLIFSILIFGFYGPEYSANEFIYENF